MRDVKFQNGVTLAYAEFVAIRGGETLTAYQATKGDLELIANNLIEKLLNAEYFMELGGSCSKTVYEMMYVSVWSEPSRRRVSN